jgi:hypothetical protein
MTNCYIGRVLIFLSPIKYHTAEPEFLRQRTRNQGKYKEMNECEERILTGSHLTAKFFRFERCIRCETSRVYFAKRLE